jgi:hypothetical protein
MKPFFHWNPKLLGLGRQVGQMNFGAFGVFSAKLSAPILAHVFHCSIVISTKKLSLYIHIPNKYLGFEFGPRRIRDLAFMCPYSVAITIRCSHVVRDCIWEAKTCRTFNFMTLLALHMVSFENFVKSMTPCLLKLKTLSGFCFQKSNP